MSNKTEEKFVVDFSQKKTEAGWISAIDRFGLQATPIWFTWIGWIFALGALQFLFQRSSSVLLGIVVGISYALLWFYFWGFFFRIEFRGLAPLRRPNAARIISIVASGVLAFVTWRAATLFAAEIAKFQ